ncbi:hypothetical protein K432DRAFT_232586 [Lepidopterella palustris CBS 459.81]|uniref:Uncharacterized protein n=1 Tax=Lepidopterella palustris CBS 459.81 TaxID=1314670 RepID=A0A8E2J9A3_9PEZI|nr:hypothetical protein K432DRAFT_232586 [Lepidopterella palustris CBS 459.81]
MAATLLGLLPPGEMAASCVNNKRPRTQLSKNTELSEKRMTVWTGLAKLCLRLERGCLPSPRPFFQDHPIRPGQNCGEPNPRNPNEMHRASPCLPKHSMHSMHSLPSSIRSNALPTLATLRMPHTIPTCSGFPYACKISLLQLVWRLFTIYLI